MNALRSFVRAPLEVKAMALEAALLLLLARLLVRHVPMRHWRRRLTTADEAAPAAGTTGDARDAFLPGGSGTRAPARGLPSHRPLREARAEAAGQGPAPPAGHASSGRLRSRRVARIVRKVARHPPFRSACLPQAMAAQWMLRRRGMESRLFFGARRKAQGPGLQFHAWLSVAGEPVLGGEEAGTWAALPPFDGIGPYFE